MTRVIAVRPAPNCFDGSFMKEVEIDEPLAEPVMRRIARGGALDYHPEFPRPYFRAQVDGAFIVQGVFGSARFRATLSRTDTDGAQALLRRRIEQEE